LKKADFLPKSGLGLDVFVIFLFTLLRIVWILNNVFIV